MKEAAISGAVSGAITGLTADIIAVTGGSAAVVVGAYAVGGAAGGALGSIAGSVATGKKVNPTTVLKEAAIGGAFGAISGCTVGAVPSMMKSVRQSAGRKALSRGITVRKAVTKTIKREARRIGSSFFGECISGFTSWYTRNRIKNIYGRRR